MNSKDVQHSKNYSVAFVIIDELIPKVTNVTASSNEEAMGKALVKLFGNDDGVVLRDIVGVAVKLNETHLREWEEIVIHHLKQGNRLEAVRYIKKATGWPIKSCVRFVDMAKENHKL